MGSEEEKVDADNRWSEFVDPDKHKRLGTSARFEPPPDLSEYLSKLLLQKSPRERQEKKYKTALRLVNLLTGVAYTLNPEWKMFTNPDNKTGVKKPPLRTLSEDQYESMVSLKRPVRLDGLKIYQRSIDEMPQHRCLIQLNKKLSRQEAHLVHNEWGTLMDKNGCLKPKSVLNWFNQGLNEACKLILKENHNVDKMIPEVLPDGTVNVHATVTEFDGESLEIEEFAINIYPVYILDEIPTSLKLAAPLPCFGNYIQGQKKFRELVLKDIEEGKDVAFLDPKSEAPKSPIKGLSKDGPTWRINLSFTEYHVYSLIDQYCRGLNFRHVLVLANILRQENLDELYILNNEILVNTLFVLSQKHIDKMRTKSEWIFRFLQSLIDGLRSGFLPSFHLPRHNLLASYDVDEGERKMAGNKLKVILESIKEDPQTLFDFTGYDVDKKQKRDDTADDVIESELDDADEEEEATDTLSELHHGDLKGTDVRKHEMNTVYETEEEMLGDTRGQGHEDCLTRNETMDISIGNVLVDVPSKNEIAHRDSRPSGSTENRTTSLTMCVSPQKRRRRQRSHTYIFARYRAL